MDNTCKSKGRKPKVYSQADRLASMMRTLASRAVTINGLAGEFWVTRRQVYRDLAEIEKEGHPLERSVGSGEQTWQLPLGYKGLPQIAITQYELMSLHLAKNHLAYLNGTPFVDDLDSVIAKVEAGLPAKTANHLERIVGVFTPLQRGTRSYAKKSGLLLQLTVSLTYKKPDANKASVYLVDPYALVLYEQGLYVAGYSHRSHAERLFAVDRIQKITLTEERFEIPVSYSSIERYVDQFGLIEGLPQEVRVWFSEDVAHLMLERQWHPSQRIKKLKNGSVEVTFHAGGIDEIAWWVLSWGKEAKVLSPPRLVKIMASQLSKSLKHYPRA
jgi:proteasome accessory factor B